MLLTQSKYRTVWITTLPGLKNNLQMYEMTHGMWPTVVPYFLKLTDKRHADI